MPTPEVILEQLAATAQTSTSIAVAWHLVLTLVLAALWLGWRPSQRLAACLLALPLVSVAGLAWRAGNSFNFAAMGLGAVALVAIGSRLPAESVNGAPALQVSLGSLLLALGAAYPHFLEHGARVEYLYRAPLGVVPCPTLAAVVGLAILASGFGAPAWSSTLAGLAVFYGVFGALRLNVALDGLLVLGAVALLGLVWAPRTTQASRN